METATREIRKACRIMNCADCTGDEFVRAVIVYAAQVGELAMTYTGDAWRCTLLEVSAYAYRITTCLALMILECFERFPDSLPPKGVRYEHQFAGTA